MHQSFDLPLVRAINVVKKAMETSAERKFLDGSKPRTSHEMEVFRNEVKSATNPELQMMVEIGLSRQPKSTMVGNQRILLEKLGEALPESAFPHPFAPPIPSIAGLGAGLVPQMLMAPPILHSDVVDDEEDDDCIDVTLLGIGPSTRRGGTGSDGRRTNQTERSTQLFGRFPFFGGRFERVADMVTNLRSTLLGHSDEVMNFFVSMVTNVDVSLKGNTRIVIGPPGSGKSHIIQHVIRAVKAAGGKAEAF